MSICIRTVNQAGGGATALIKIPTGGCDPHVQAPLSWLGSTALMKTNRHATAQCAASKTLTRTYIKQRFSQPAVARTYDHDVSRARICRRHAAV